MKSQTLIFLLGLGLTGCQIGDGLEDYYADAAGAAPSVDSVQSDDTRTGNTGGQTAIINGSGFGDDPAGVTVVIGNLNATLVEVTDNAITVVLPQGPVEGGPVDVTVGTANGRTTLEGGWTYDVGSVYDGQSAYIVINNDWFSCYGGVGTEFGCETFAWVGYTGIDGRGEFLEEELFPRQHGQFVGYWGGADVQNEWVVQSPAYNYIPLDIEGAVEDLRDKRITNFSLYNPALQDEDPWCSDLSRQASYLYPGGQTLVDDDGAVIGVSGAVSAGFNDTDDYVFLDEADTTDGRCDDPNDGLYDLDTLKFCETHYDNDANLSAYERAGTWIYDAEWPIGEHSFFVGESGDPSEPENVVVELNVPEVSIQDLPLVLPPWARFNATAGLNGFNGDDSLWPIGDLDACPDGNGDGVSTLDEAAWRFEWIPAELGDVVGGQVKDVDVQVRLSINSFFLGWYGGEGFNMRASIVVPDDFQFDESTGMSRLEVPTSILMQFPNLTSSLGEVQDPFGGTTFIWGDPIGRNYGYLLVTMERVTEYRIDAPELAGDLVVSYVTGDFGFFDWNNPLESGDTCGDCQDNDGDGWTDDKDPDCEGDGPEDNHSFGATTCNDDIDNDEDGFTDAEDDDCEDGLDGETNCSDGIDNDGDGFEDGLDGECGPKGSGVELGDDNPAWQCSNGLDDDGDGWIDFNDPDCTNGSDPETGFGKTACNDGVDNDDKGDADATDLLCVLRGATYDAEAPSSMTGDCANKLDDDGDGYMDANDPDCEIQPYSIELYTEAQSDDWNGWTSECYNATDDDSDGFTDGLDPDCSWNSAPSGFVASEG